MYRKFSSLSDCLKTILSYLLPLLVISPPEHSELLLDAQPLTKF